MPKSLDEHAQELAANARQLLDDARRESLPVREELESLKTQNQQLQERISVLEVDHRKVLDQYVRAEHAAGEMSALYVASHRLLDAVVCGEVVTAIGEIVADLVGSEEYALFAADPKGLRLTLLRAVGIDAAAFESVALGDGTIGNVAATGEPWVNPTPPEALPEGAMTLCLPLFAGREVVGALALWRLLPHKSGLGPRDHALLKLLSTHGGLALQMGGKPGGPPSGTGP